jgi:hypothetical protein
MTVITDVQGFHLDKNSINNSFVVKELAALNLSRGSFHHFVFKVPKSLGPNESDCLYKNVKWVTTFYHGIDWYEGTTPYEHLSTILDEVCKDDTQIFVKGNEKASLLRRLITLPVTNLAILGCPALKLVRPRTEFCKLRQHRNSTYNCAVANVSWLSCWLNGERNKNEHSPTEFNP